MQRKTKGAGICLALLAAVAMAGLVGCPAGGDDQGTGALLSSVAVADYDTSDVPLPISLSDWQGEVPLANLGDEHLGNISLQNPALNVVVTVVVSAGARVELAVHHDRPAFGMSGYWVGRNEEVSLLPGSFLLVRVTSEDGRTTNHYRFQVHIASAVATLWIVNFVSGEDSVVASLGTPNAVWTDVLPGAVGLGHGMGANITVSATPTNAQAELRFAMVAGGDGAPDFGANSVFNLADEDAIFIEVTSENGENVLVYRIDVEIGRVATISSVTVGEIGLPGTQGHFGPAFESLELAMAGTGGLVLLTIPHDASAFPITVTTLDPGATYRIGRARGSETPEFGSAMSLAFDDGDFLYVESTSANGRNTVFYKIPVHFRQTTVIRFGSPAIENNAIDPIWNDPAIEVLPIERVFAGDSSSAFAANPDTFGVARLLWDQDGLYVFVEVTDPAISTGLVGAHLIDSVELFINEDASVLTGGWAGIGGQFRLGALGERSGNPAAAVADFEALDSFSYWTTPDGYIVIFQAPWRYLLADLSPGELDGTDIRIEIQINACIEVSERVGVITWNNLAHSNWQNVTNFGTATLYLQGD